MSIEQRRARALAITALAIAVATTVGCAGRDANEPGAREPRTAGSESEPSGDAESARDAASSGEPAPCADWQVHFASDVDWGRCRRP